MEFRRNGLRDERRRRVLIDETLHAGTEQEGPSEAPAVPARSPAKAYSDAAIASSQTPVTCLLPKRPVMMWVVWLFGMLLIAGIELLYRYAFLASPEELRARFMALDVLARGSLAGWFAGVVLAVSAFVSFLIFQIRRHRTDDYRGRYRWWLWLVPLLLLMSVSASTGLHEGLSGGLTALTGAEVAVDGKGWWLLAYGAVFFPVVLQLSLEVWRSRLGLMFLFLTLSEYCAASVFELRAIVFGDPLTTAIAHSSVLLSAHLSLLITLLAYGRYVYLEAHDQLAARRKWLSWRPKKKASAKKKTSAPKAARGKQVRVDEPHQKFGQENPAPTVTLKPAAAAKALVNEPEFDEESDDDEEEDSRSNRKLSKAERRRLKRETQR